MRNFIILSCFLFLLISCTTTLPNYSDDNALTFEQNEDEEYDILVLDPGYETYLRSIARPMNHYSESYYKNKNRDYVMEWNYRHSQPLRYDSDFYSTRIEYDYNKDYGINLEYKLYNFFEYIKWKYKVDLGFRR